MTRIVPVQQRKEIISRNILGRENIMQVPRKDFQKRKVGSFFDESLFKGKTSKVCFVCKRSGHFAKNCPKKEKAAKLLEQAQIHAEDTPFLDVESLFSLDDEYSR